MEMIFLFQNGFRPTLPNICTVNNLLLLKLYKINLPSTQKMTNQISISYFFLFQIICFNINTNCITIGPNLYNRFTTLPFHAC